MPVDWYWPALGAAVGVLLAVPLAWFVENRRFTGRRELQWLVLAASALPAPLLIYFLLARDVLGAEPSGFGMAAAAVVSVTPYVLRQSRAAFVALSPAYAKAARSLGLPEELVFARVELPLVRRRVAIAAGWALARVVLEFAAAVWIAGARA